MTIDLTVSLPAFVLTNLDDLALRQPILLRYDEVRCNRHQGNGTKDDRSIVESVRGDWEIVR